MPARAAIRRSGSVGPGAASSSGSTTDRRRKPSLRPRSSASDAVRRDVLHRFAGVEVVGELGALVFLARHDRRPPLAAFPQQLAQPADELGVLGELSPSGSSARLRARRATSAMPFVRVDVRRAASLRARASGPASSATRQRLEPGLARDLRLGAPLRLVGQVEIFEPRLGVGARESRRRAPASACPARRCSSRIAARRSSSSRR